MKIIVIVAYGTNRCIGKDGKLPNWKIPADMEHFKQITTGHAVLMGRKTYESIPRKFRPLPDRDNIVLSREHKNVDPHPQVFTRKTLRDGIKAAEESGHEKLFIIGGGEIYRQALEEKEFLVDEIIATEIKASFEGDTFFPEIDDSVWRLKRTLLFSSEHESDDPADIDFKIVLYTKK